MCGPSAGRDAAWSISSAMIVVTHPERASAPLPVKVKVGKRRRSHPSIFARQTHIQKVIQV